jgi:hypothetical protein
MATSNLPKILGLVDDDGSYNVPTAATSITTISVPQMYQPLSYYVTISFDNSTNANTTFGGSTLRYCSFVLPRTAEWNGVDEYTFSDYPMEVEIKTPIKRIQLRVTNESGTNIDFMSFPITALLEY